MNRYLIQLMGVILVLAVGVAWGQSITWTEYASNPIFGMGTIPAGPKAYYPSVVYDASSFSGHGVSHPYKMWFGSSTGVGVVYSDDGIAWTQETNPLSGISGSPNHPVGKYYSAGFTGANSGSNPSSSTMYYRLWYWPALTYTINDIRYAESPDDINWYNDQPLVNGTVPIITGPGGSDWNRGSYGALDVLYNPTASNSGTDWTFTMYYDGTTGGQEEVGLAFSSDAITWSGYDANSDGKADPVLVGSGGSAWDKDYVSRCTVLKLTSTDYRMWYSGGSGNMQDGIGYAASTDGINWSKFAGNPILYKNDGIGWRNVRTYTPSVIKFGETYKMWFAGLSGSNYSIGYATGSPPPVHNVTQNIYYSAIQAAINAANAGDVITVAAGIYHERLAVNKSLDLRGAQYGVDPTPAGARTNSAVESVVDVVGLVVPNPDVLLEIPSGTTNVFVSGFTLIGGQTTPHNADQSTIRCWDDNLTIQDNIIDGFYCILYKGNDYTTIQRNRLTANKVGITVQPNAATHVTISNNKITPGGSPEGDAAAIYMTTSTDCSVSGNSATGFSNSNGVGGSNHTRLTVSGNTFTSNKKGVNIWGNSTFITISRNTLSNSIDRGIDIKGADINISENVVTNNGGYGIRIAKDAITTERVTIYNNNITGNATKDIFVDAGTGVTETVNASGNWFGSNDPATVATRVSTLVDYAPWLGVGTDTQLGTAGFQGDFSNLWVSAASPQVGSTTRIQEGINLVTGSTVNVVAGTYVENVNINKAVKVLGAGAASTTIDGNNAGNCITIATDVNGVTVDGFELKNGYNGISGETDNSALKDCKIHDNLNTPGYTGVGISLWGDCDSDTISNNEIYNNDRQGVFIGYSDGSKISTGNKIVSNTIHDNGKFTKGGLPDESEYGIQLWNADYNLIQGNTIYNQNDWYFGNGVYLCSSRYNTVAGNSIHDNKYNVGIWDCGGPSVGARSAAGNKIQANTLVNPGQWSVKTFSDARTTYVNFNVFNPGTATVADKYIANSVAATLNAEWNWFGGQCPAEGLDFSGNVDCTNCFATNMTVSVIPSVYYLPLDGAADVPVMALVPAGTYVRGTDVTLSWDNDANIPDQSGPTQGSFFTAKVGTGQSEFYDYNPHTVVNTVRVNQGLLGGSTGAGNASVPYVGVLFTMNYKGVAAGTSNLTLSSVQVRDVDNNNITPLVLQNAQLVCDATAPSVTNVLIDNTTLNTDENSDGQDDYVKNTDNVTVTATVTDDHPLTTADIFADLSGFYGGSGHTSDNPSSYVSNTATWTVSGVTCSPTDGIITVDVLARDVAGNEGTGSDNIISDNIKPTNATNLFAKTVTPGGHGKVSLSWTAGSDAHYKGVLIRYNNVWGTSGYPVYTGTAPAYPTTKEEGVGTAADVAAGTTTAMHTVSSRGIYYYSAFAYDWAGNCALDDASTHDKSASYYLGDVSPATTGDGSIDFNDLMVFSLNYFKTDPTGADAESDFGPTVANKTYAARNRFAVPAPDTKVDFEDLMIFAMNYHNVEPKLSAPADDAKPAKEFALELRRQMTNSEEMAVTVHVANDGKHVKGTSVVVRFDPTYLAVKEVTGGTVFGPIGQLAFFAHKEESSTVQIDAAALGVDRTVDYSGDIGTIRFKVLKSGETGLRFDGVKVRNGANEEVSAQTKIMEGVSTTIPLPTTYDIAQNYPNPFNPTTTIAYQVPEVAHVTLEIYNVLGEKVATLVDEQRAAGYYRVEWNGKDSGQRSVSSGVYYYRMSAGQYTSIKKMLLVK